MTDARVPLIGPVYGWRTWDVVQPQSPSRWVDAGTSSPRLSSRGGAWTDPAQDARCVRESMIGASMRALFGGTPVGPDPVREPHEPATDPSCWCGLYAHSTLARCLDDREAGIRQGRLVLGLVRAWGQMFAADRGFRAQHMAVDTLVCAHLPLVSRDPERDFVFAARPDLRWTWRLHQPDVRQIGRGLGVDVVCRQLSKRSLTRAFADRDGVYLWRKEAPWTSDVIPEPSRSSTPRMHTGGLVPYTTTTLDPTTYRLSNWQAAVSESLFGSDPAGDGERGQS